MEPLGSDILSAIVLSYLNSTDLRCLYNTRNKRICMLFLTHHHRGELVIRWASKCLKGPYERRRYTIYDACQLQEHNDERQYLQLGVTELLFDDDFNKFICVGMLPPTITRVKFGVRFNHPLVAGSLPPSVTHVAFGFCFNQPLLAGALPPGVTNVTFGHSFNRPLRAGTLPHGVTHVTFGYDFNQPLLAGTLPHSITHSTIGRDFNESLRGEMINRGVIIVKVN